MSRGVLVDLVRCMGCRGCQVACKAWNDNAGETTECMGSYENPAALSADTWTRVQYMEVEDTDGLHWVFAKRQCMHCLHPACVSACPVQALHKLDDGPVVYEGNKCIGCRYCMMACPFHVPRINFDEVLPLITKCVFCADRISEGLEPACVKACPSDALTFGERDELIAEARQRIAARPNKYETHIYGENEVGGTSWMYVSPVPFDKLGTAFPDVGTETVTDISEKVAIYGTPSALIAVGGLLTGVYWITKRRAEQMSKASVKEEA